MRKVKIKALPKDLPQAKDGHETEAKLWNGVQQNWPTVMNQFSLPPTTVGKTLQPVDKKDANLEAEKGETAIINQDGIPTNFNVGGKRHSEGGTPLNLPSNSFIFSDTKDMKIKDKTILEQFNASKGMTPADISKKYDINKFRGVLADPDSSDLDRSTAEMMIANYNIKLAKLGLVQESKKGFPQGIPAISMPYVESMQMNPNDFFITQAQPEQFNPDMTAKLGGLTKAQEGLSFQPFMPAAGTYNVSPVVGDFTPPPPAKGNKTVQMTPQEYVDMIKAKGSFDILDTGKSKDVKMHSVSGSDLEKLNTTTPQTANPDTIYNFKAGGSLPSYQEAGPVKKRHGWYFEQGLYKLYNNDTLVKFQKENPKTAKSAAPKTGTVAKPVKSGDPAEMDIYTPETVELLKRKKAEGKDIILPEIAPPGTKRLPVQHGVKGEKNIYGKVDWKNKAVQDDFFNRQPWVLKERPDFNPADNTIVGKWTENVGHHKVGDPMTKGDQDTLWVQKRYDEMHPGYFNQKGVKGTGLDSDFGAHTFSMPGYKDKTPTGEEDAGLIAKSPEERKKIAAAALATQKQSGHDPWWLQDVIKTAGAAGDFFRVKKYAPWQATPGVDLPDPTFYDPTRELAANAEMANIGVQGANAFTNPQAFAAAFSQIQGQGVKNAADILGKYNQMNVGIANDFELRRTDIMNQASANRAGLSTQLADKYTIMNQQFDNSKNMARQNLRQSFIDAVTNKNYTGNLNDLYEQYKIDPSTGGRIKWTHGRPINPEETDQDMISKVNATALALRKQNPGLDPDKAVEHAIKLHSAGASGNKMYGQEAMGYPGS